MWTGSRPSCSKARSVFKSGTGLSRLCSHPAEQYPDNLLATAVNADLKSVKIRGIVAGSNAFQPPLANLILVSGT